MLERLKSKRFYPVIFLTIIVLVSVSLLLYINTFTSEVVEAQNRARIQEVLQSIFPDLTDFQEDEGLIIIYKGDSIEGYAFTASGSGYSGAINMLVGINPDHNIKDISILSQTETPGLGSRITEKEFTEQFAGLAPDDIVLSRDGGSIDAITGATISSRAVTDAVREEMSRVIEMLLK
jgi:Na+-translocating ferredoxin:NAD+ oxidoreductase subunit G